MFMPAKGGTPWNKGKKMSPATCLKMSLSRRGEKSCMWGKPSWNSGRRGVYSEETIKKMSLAQQGKHHTVESKQKMSDTKKKMFNDGVLVARNLGRHLSESTKQKIREANLGKKLSEETKQKMSFSRKGKRLSEGSKKQLSLSKRGIRPSEATKQKLREANLGPRNPNYGKPKSLETKMKMRESALKRSPESFRKGLIRRTPSSLESKFQDIIAKLNLPYLFVGDGGFIIERKCPDFINTNHLKIAIEVYNRSHKNKFRRGGLEGWKSERSEIFSRYGWRIEFFDETQVNEAEVARRLM